MKLINDFLFQGFGVKDKSQKAKLFNALHEYDCIKKKGDWAIKWINDTNYLDHNTRW